MAQIFLDDAGADTIVGELVAGMVAQVVRMNRKRQAGLDAKLGHSL